MRLQPSLLLCIQPFETVDSDLVYRARRLFSVVSHFAIIQPASSMRWSAGIRRTARQEAFQENRAVPFSFGGFDLGLSEQVARLFPGEPVPCPVAGLADTLQRHDSLGHAAIEQPVFGLLRPACGSPTAAD